MYFTNTFLLPILISLISSFIFLVGTVYLNKKKVKRKIKSLYKSFSKNIEYLKEICGGSLILTKKCVNRCYSIREDMKGSYKSLLAYFTSEKLFLQNLSEAPYVNGKVFDDLSSAIQTYVQLVSGMQMLITPLLNGYQIPIGDEYQQDLTNYIEVLNTFYKKYS